MSTATILVAYASSAGSTKSIAERLAATMQAQFTEKVDCMPCADVAWPHSYRAVVVGSAVHAGTWLPAARKFLDAHNTDLYQIPMFAFSVGAIEAQPEWLLRRTGGEAKAEAKESQKVGNDVSLDVGHPIRHELFEGVADRKTMGSAVGFVWRLMGFKFGDFRDWKKVDAYANDIVKELKTDGF